MGGWQNLVGQRDKARQALAERERALLDELRRCLEKYSSLLAASATAGPQALPDPRPTARPPPTPPPHAAAPRRRRPAPGYAGSPPPARRAAAAARARG